MRYGVPGFLLLYAPAAAAAQDTGLQALQMQQQQMIQQQVNQQQLSIINQQQLDQATAAANLGSYQLTLFAPKLEQHPGTEPGTVIVTMRDRSRGTSIFYTTDGWTPTPVSERYLGPITLRGNVTLRAIAIAAGGQRSYTTTLPIVLNSAASASSPAPAPVTSLAPGTTVPLVFSAPVTSRGKKIGDPLPVALGADLVINGEQVADRGAPVDAIVTGIDNSHVQGLPGVLSFAVRSVQLENGAKLTLLGVETMEGADRTRSAGFASIVPLAGLAIHGGDALIPAGSRFDARIADSPKDQMGSQTSQNQPPAGISN